MRDIYSFYYVGNMKRKRKGTYPLDYMKLNDIKIKTRITEKSLYPEGMVYLHL